MNAYDEQYFCPIFFTNRQKKSYSHICAIYGTWFILRFVKYMYVKIQYDLNKNKIQNKPFFNSLHYFKGSKTREKHVPGTYKIHISFWDFYVN